MVYRSKLKGIICALALAVSSLTQAENIGNLGTEQDDESSGYFQIGFAGGWADRPLEDDFNDFGGLVIEGRYEWNNAFVELTSDSIGVPGFAIGYELWENPNWAVDLVAIPVQGELNPRDIERLENSNLRKREGLTLTGVRATRFFNEFILQGHLLPLGRGTVVSIAAGKFWQIKNWNISALAALRYNSSEVNQRSWDVTAIEASIDFPEYQSGSDVNAMLQLRAEYPITENWVAESTLFYTSVGDSIYDSPLVAKRQAKGIAFEISYVF